ncbi:putative chitinase [Helianthus annuus]|uniref:Chitinase n=1 Tax=Helianthus annuus TaxID=4232 RepID=A0A251TH53_HELAN|nr:class V chitinase CHIT5a isoform X2 [Helianthus annuus]KAF5802759.1 putative chitinase [Helianthus annuus]KAJ0560841.1 putative chitinase [Helianthus annuus]KAJ0573881.1 putative chitinase [Helianthus annuus]KAJ0738217.1 putative chitinase [Helianthus annuus]KAJ0915794.1 putative chitinase [Helianthus annuus]
MEFLNAPTISLVILSLAICSSTSATNSMYYSHGPNKGAYWPSWSIDFPPSAIDTTLFSHAYYAFLSPNNVTFKFDVDYPTALSLKNFTTTLHKKKPSIKTLLSIGGAAEGPILFSHMASSYDSRKNFILSTIEVARKFDFDGVDLDWEFPQTPIDMVNFRHLLHEWRVAVKKEAKSTCRPQLLLSAATYYKPEITLDNVYRKYPVKSINKNLDWINAMCYDYHGSWDLTTTGAQAALYDPNSNVSTSYGLHSWIKAKIQREKLVMGLPLYGRTWQLKDPSLYGIGAPAVDVGPGIQGQLGYADVEKFNIQNNAKVVFDLSTVSVYSVAGNTWIGYDDARSVKIKVEYAKTLKIGGYFFWAVDADHEWKISRQASKTWVI